MVKPGLPASVRVVGQDIPILVRSAEDDAHLDGLFGYCDHARGRIVVDVVCSDELRKETVLHEVVHACELATKTDIGEEAVHRLSRAMFAVIRDNPELMEWLQANG